MKMSVLLVVVLVVLVVLVVPALGAVHHSGELLEIKYGETINDDLFAGTREMRIYGRVNGDVYAVGENLLIEGEVTQDVQAGCRYLRITGKVGDDVLFFGQELLIDGEIGGDVKAIGAQVRMTPGAIIRGDLFAAGGKLQLNGGLIQGHLKGRVGSAYINGRVNGDSDLKTGEIVYGPDFQTQGDTRLTLDKPLDRDQAGHVPDNLDIVIKKQRRAFPFFGMFGKIWSVVAAFIFGLVIVLFFKRTTRDFLDFARPRALRNTAWGFVYLVVVPAVVLILFLMIFTIPIALVVSAIYLIALYLGIILAGLSVGEWLMGRIRRDPLSRSLILPLIVGIVLVKIITQIPIVGCLIALVLVCYGLGSLVNFLRNSGKLPEASAEA